MIDDRSVTAETRVMPPSDKSQGNWILDPRSVAAEYSSEVGLSERVVAHRELLEGPDDENVVRERIRSLRPSRLLDVGSGLGELSVWAKAQLWGDVVAVDSSRRMVQLAAQAGVIAVLADARSLPFADAFFDCAVANFVLYHVDDPATAIAELARVLKPDGVLVTSTISDDTETRRRAWARLYFQRVEKSDCDAVLVFQTRERLVRYVDAIPPMRGCAARLPELNEPFRLADKTTVFVASKAPPAAARSASRGVPALDEHGSKAGVSRNTRRMRRPPPPD
jgi:SAM-dependent methyltransferase